MRIALLLFGSREESTSRDGEILIRGNLFRAEGEAGVGEFWEP